MAGALSPPAHQSEPASACPGPPEVPASAPDRREGSRVSAEAAEGWLGGQGQRRERRALVGLQSSEERSVEGRAAGAQQREGRRPRTRQLPRPLQYPRPTRLFCAARAEQPVSGYCREATARAVYPPVSAGRGGTGGESSLPLSARLLASFPLSRLQLLGVGFTAGREQHG